MKSQKGQKATEVEGVNACVTDILHGFYYGETISHEWFEEHLWIDRPEVVQRKNMEAAYKEWSRAIDAYKLAYMNCIGKVKLALQKHHIYITSIRGVGYKILTPREHAQHGVHSLLTRVSRGFLKATQCHTSCEVRDLTNAELKEFNSKSAKVQKLHAAFNKEVLKYKLHKTVKPKNRPKGKK